MMTNNVACAGVKLALTTRLSMIAWTFSTPLPACSGVAVWCRLFSKTAKLSIKHSRTRRPKSRLSSPTDADQIFSSEVSAPVQLWLLRSRSEIHVASAAISLAPSDKKAGFLMHKISSGIRLFLGGVGAHVRACRFLIARTYFSR